MLRDGFSRNGRCCRNDSSASATEYLRRLAPPRRLGPEIPSADVYRRSAKRFNALTAHREAVRRRSSAGSQAGGDKSWHAAQQAVPAARQCGQAGLVDRLRTSGGWLGAVGSAIDRARDVVDGALCAGRLATWVAGGDHDEAAIADDVEQKFQPTCHFRFLGRVRVAGHIRE